MSYTLGVADVYSAENNASIIYQVANVLDISDVVYGTEKEIKIANGTGVTINASTLTWTGDKNHGLSVTSSTQSGYVKVTGTTGGINGAVDNTSEDGTTVIDYSVIADEHFNPDGTNNNNVIEKSTFSITGDGIVPGTNHQIILDTDMIVNGDSILDLENVIFSGSKALKNKAGGHLNIKDSLITVAIENAGIFVSDPNTYTARHTNSSTATYNGDTFHDINSTGKNGGALYNTGILTVQKEVVGTDTYNPTFTNNTAANGGAIWSNKAKDGDDIKVNISDAIFTKNTASGDGGAIYNTGAMSITNSTFGDGTSANKNSANSGYGGAIENSGILVVDGSTFKGNTAYEAGAIDNYGGNVTISGISKFIGNSATTSAGAIYNTGGATLNINGTTTENTLFDGNSAANGGAVFNAGTMTQTYGTYQNNTATSYGGAIYSSSSTGTASLTLNGTTFDNNSAVSGGAIIAASNTNLTVQSGSEFTNNKATGTDTSVGGAIYGNSNSNIIVDNSDFSDNSTVYGGGAIAVINSDLTVRNNSKFIGNTVTAGDGGGAIYVTIKNSGSSSLSVKDTEFYRNSSASLGGAITTVDGINSTVIIDNVIFGDGTLANANVAATGGAYWAGENTNIINSEFNYNKSSSTAATGNTGGGALFVGGGSDAVVINTKFTNNVSASVGGAIATRPVGSSGDSSLYITGDGTVNTAFTGNTAGAGGGAIWTEVATVIANTNFTNNTAGTNGGAISHTATASDRALGIIADGKDVTFSGNIINDGVNPAVNNDIYNTGYLELIATGTNKITLGGGIAGSEGIININDLSTIDSYKVLNSTTIEDKTITSATGNVIFNGDVSGNALNVKAGTLTNSATLTALGGSNSGTIDGSGNFILDKVGSTFTNNGSFTQTSLKITKGNFVTDADDLHLTSDIVNEDLLTFKGAGTIAQNIVKDTVGNGKVEIDAGSGNTIDITSGKTITGNIIKLTSGTFDAKNLADSDGNMSFEKFEANGGTLNIQDGKTGNISLGVVDTVTNTKALNVNIDVDLGDTDTSAVADVLNVASGSDLTNKINLNSIKWVDSTIGHHTEGDILIANNTLGDAITLAMTEIDTEVSGEPTGVGNLLVSKNYVSGEGTYLHTTHTDLKNAIVSTIDDKAYVMGTDSTIDGLKLGGSSLSVTTKGYNVTSTSNDKSKDGITFDSTTGANQSINIIGTAVSPDTTNTVISGFKTAINNTVGGTVSLKDVTMTGNTTDVLNNGEGTKGVFITGTSNLDKVAYSGSTAVGQTTIGNGDTTTDTVTIGEIIQKNVNVLSDGVLNISADKLQTTSGTDNAGTLNLSGTSGTATPSALASAISNVAGTTNITGNIATNGHNITQNYVNVGTTAGKGNLTNNNTINANNIVVTTESILESNSTIAAANGTDKALITANAGSEINLNKGSNAKADLTLEGTDTSKSMLTITDSGKLDGNVISDSGSTIELIADTENIAMSNAITGLISGSTAGSNGVYALVAHSVTNIPPTTVYSVTIDKAIAGATSISVDGDTKAIITDVAIGSNTTTPINVSNNAELTLKNTTAGTMNVENAITKAVSTDKYDVIVNNTNADGITNINNTIIGADTVTGDGGTTNLNSIITGADKVIAKAGTTNIDAGTNSNTSSRIGLADIEVKNNAIAGVKTTSDSFVLDSDVTGQSAAATLQLNGKSGTPESPSNVGTQFTIASTINGGTVELANGQLNLPSESALTNADGLRIDGGATLNTMNGATSDFNKPTEFKDGAQLKIDANVFTKATDKFINPTELGNEKLTDLSIQGLDKIYNTRSVNLTSETGLNNLQAGAGLADLISSRYPQVVTPVRLLKGQVQQTDEGLMLQFVPTAEGYEGFNSAVLAAPIAAQMGGYLTQLHSYDEAFRNMDMYMLMTKEERQAMKMRNKFATTSKDIIYDPTTTQYENKAGWFRPYATFENVGLDNGPRVSNVAYGTYAGGESEMYDLGHGWDGMWGAYVGYNGSHQAYGNHNSIYQNGGTLGLVGMAYKGDFFTGLTINAGANGAEASTMYGSENFAMLMAGIASKTGYNWELANGKFIIQPSATVSYSFVNTFDYKNAAGINISNDPLHAIQIEPGVKFIGNLKNGWQPYASVSMVWNIMDKTHFHANEVALPDMSVKPFVKYGVGVRKSWGERFTAFFQTYFTNGGRNGVGLQAGFRWTLGKSSSQKTSQNTNTQVRKEIKSK